MQIAYSFDTLRLETPALVTVGVFDGLHLGHQHLITHLVQQAHDASRLAAVVSFYPHPDVVLRGITDRFYLTPPAEKERLMRDLGVDALVMHPFDESVRALRAADFVDRLQGALNMVSLWATADFAMGYQREGDIAFLTRQGSEKGFSVTTIDHLVLASSHGLRVSSSGIRAALTEGNLAEANTALGRPYRVSGVVVHGEKRGRQIGFPTANIAAPADQLLPAHGVYACYAILPDSSRIPAVTNIGERPTFAGQTVTVEAHLLDYDGDLYDQTLALDFVARLRGEQKFMGIDALVTQIKADIEYAKTSLLN